MRGFPLHPLLAPGAAYLGRGQVAARLYDLGRYPAAVPDAGAHARGEVYRVADPALWRTLDSAEGPQYHRQGTTVRLVRGRRVQAFVYWYRGPLGGAVPVPGGDYRAHGPARALHLTATHQEETDGP
jgi:gamma-glutamylcyclotransferase (GGCT)/AIG2-like uncharacterized protein YtfP